MSAESEVRERREDPVRRNLVNALGDLYRSRGLLLGLLATAVGLLLILLAPHNATEVAVRGDHLVIGGGQDDLWTKLRITDVGVAIFQVGITLTLFQVLLNQIAEDRFVEHVRTVLDEQQEDVKLAVAQSMAASENVETLRLSPEELDHVIETASRLRSGNPELGRVISRKLRTGVFESEEIWRSLVVRAEILELVPGGSGGREHDYYEVFFQFAYYTTNVRRTRFAFRVARWKDEYDVALRAQDMGAVWRLPSTGEFDDDWSAGFTFIDATFGGRPVSFARSDIEREYVGHIPTEDFDDGQQILVQYSFSAKVLANGNLLSFEVPKPTFGATYSISVAVPGIERIRALDYFGATRPASISYAPGLDRTRVISVSVDDWILPKAGMAVVWHRRPPET
ncbi:hypothetical protein SAMN05443665_100462 [Actinomadura meyerae]|uniref:Uncharacterized protein n=1 Tax=Actinomadura meyerae TaxID=240840 RepID=A0A239EJH5_9ACTN|nr:hypothetical protein [Actinomadura meyerae]SNS44173.1 hypothetical protein SAMN05443665_100462 [Actinomadura meyerae]